VSVSTIPVVLVHGWKSHPGVWKNLLMALENENAAPCWIFDHTPMNGAPLEEIASRLLEFIQDMREQAGYSGPITIVCHSMGTCIARYMLEVIDGTSRSEHVWQLIGIGPPNNGSALAELFNDPVYGREIIEKLTGIFVPEGYNPADDIIVQQFRPGSETMQRLHKAGVRKDIRYRIILAENFSHLPGFFPPFEGKTWELSEEGTWQTTYSGDGIVSHDDSIIEGASIKIVPKDRRDLERFGDYYSHIRLPKNPEVVRLVMDYLTNHSDSGTC
jgi:hypothetical protein